jgi:hypothetical protein
MHFFDRRMDVDELWDDLYLVALNTETGHKEWEKLVDCAKGAILAKNVEKGSSGSAQMGATQATNNSVMPDAVKAFSAAGRAGTQEKLLIHHWLHLPAPWYPCPG